MMLVYDNKWVRMIVALQHDDGSWGCFHTLSKPTKAQPMTTEQALRRLYILGLTKEDEPIQKALAYMRDCLTGKRRLPDRHEKVLNWDAFEAHMLATWIRLFDPDDPLAIEVAQFWADLVTLSFKSGAFDRETYASEYRKYIPPLHKGERLIILEQFYMVNLLKGLLDPETEGYFLDHIIRNETGIYYIYGSRIMDVPAVFASKHTSSYIGALEQLAGYACAFEKLKFAVDWLNSHRNADGQWDLGPSAKDGVYLPLSDSWRRPENRVHDCTHRINKLLTVLEGG